MRAHNKVTSHGRFYKSTIYIEQWNVVHGVQCSIPDYGGFIFFEVKFQKLYSNR